MLCGTAVLRAFCVAQLHACTILVRSSVVLIVDLAVSACCCRACCKYTCLPDAVPEVGRAVYTGAGNGLMHSVHSITASTAAYSLSVVADFTFLQPPGDWLAHCNSKQLLPEMHP